MDKTTTGLLKHALIELYTHYPDSGSLPVFYTDFLGLSMNEIADLGFVPGPAEPLPLPAQSCILALGWTTEEARPKSNDDVIGYFDVLTLIRVQPKSGQITTIDERGHEDLAVRRHGVDMWSYSLSRKLVWSQIGMIFSTSERDHRWVVSVEPNSHTDKGHDLGDLKLPNFLLSFSLGLINAPCRYRTTIRDPEGFGPKRGGVKEATSNKPIVRIVGADRLYRDYNSSPNAEPAKRVPHPRRGHIRHLWARSGIDRHELPDNPAERQRIAKTAGVKEVYVHEAWVGPDKFETEDGMVVEVPDQSG